MKKLTPEFVKKQGFEYNETINEEDFSYEEYINKNYNSTIIIFFNYNKIGDITSYDIELCCMELKNVGEEELLTLLRIIPKE